MNTFSISTHPSDTNPPTNRLFLARILMSRGPGCTPMRRPLAVLLLLLLPTLAGCLSDSDKDGGRDLEVLPDNPTHVLDGSTEPVALLAPTFQLRGPLATADPVLGAGEPSIWVALDGTIYVAFPGCDQPITGDPLGAGNCPHGPLYRSQDDGATFERMNQASDGRYSPDGPSANGDADVAVDSAGTVYVSNLGGGGIQLHRYDGNWTYLGNIVPPTENPNDDPDRRDGADRQWLAAAGPGHVINTWMRTSPARDVAINTTFDGGATWTGTTYFGNDIGWLGTVQFAPDGKHAYIPYTQPITTAPVADIYGGQEFSMHVAYTADGGLTWNDVDTGARWFSSMTGGHWSGTQMAPSLDVTGDGTVVLVWAQDEFLPESTPPYTATSASTILYAITSKDHGTTWTEPAFITPPGIADTPFGTSIMPWVTGGAGDRFAVTFLHNDSPLDGDYIGLSWDVMALVADGMGTDDERIVYATIDTNVHQGGICTRGGLCILTASDRALLDFFEADLLPDGRLIVVYPADPLTGGKTIEMRIAIQDGGTLMAIPSEPQTA